MVQYSGQNLALGKKTTASSIDNYAGCRDKYCSASSASGKHAVDGKNDGNCFRSLSEYKPWLMIHLDGLRAVTQLKITSSTDDMKNVKISVGK